MSYKPGWVPGRWSAICDVCGFRYHSDQIRERWDGLKVCSKDWEQRHPQDFIKAIKEDITPPWTRVEPTPDTYINVCYLWQISAYTGLATADCARADNTTYPYLFLLDLSDG